MTRAALALVAAMPTVTLAQVPLPEITQYLAKGETVEARANGDLNGDGLPDSTFIGAGEDKRTLYVVLSSKGEVSIDQDLRGKGALEPYALGAAEMSIARGVLTVKDLVGGTTATQATYRLRYEPATKKMRLIGLDANLYSRTWAHDGWETSWNLLTGDRTTRALKLHRPGGPYVPGPLVKSKRATKPVYVEMLPEVEGVTGG